MSVGHAGEQAFHWALKEGGTGGVVGAVIGAIAGWPRQASTFNGLINVVHYHNAFASGEFTHVVEAGLFGGGIIAVAGGLLGLTIGQARRQKPAA
jgi:hypothetical protein